MKIIYKDNDHDTLMKRQNANHLLSRIQKAIDLGEVDVVILTQQEYELLYMIGHIKQSYYSELNDGKVLLTGLVDGPTVPYKIVGSE